MTPVLGLGLTGLTGTDRLWERVQAYLPACRWNSHKANQEAELLPCHPESLEAFLPVPEGELMTAARKRGHGPLCSSVVMGHHNCYQDLHR